MRDLIYDERARAERKREEQKRDRARRSQSEPLSRVKVCNESSKANNALSQP